MSKIRPLVRASAALALAGVALSCDHNAEVFRPEPADDLFRSYVAIGNSLAAGVQSDGINDSTQRRSYAFLLAQSMRTRFAYPSLAGRGCVPPIANWQTGARIGTGSTSSTCDLRNPQVATDILNNVAVPAAASTEVNAQTSPYHNTLTTLFLGGKTQVERALEASPTFVSIWIGGNDVLQAAGSGIVTATQGISRGITPPATFTANYDAMTAALTAGAPGLKGIIVSVPQTANIPLLFPVAAFQDPAFLRGFSQAAGAPTGTDIFVHPNCTASGALVSFAILSQMRSGAHPQAIVCQKNTPGFPAPVGDIFILDAEDQAALQSAVTAYNTYLQSKATQLDFAYYDSNQLLGQLKATACASTVPNLAASGTTSPFGACFSFDGIHPSNTGYARIANELIGAINTKYTTSLATVTVP
jgi:lysophospholipase L1-like esterase